MNEVRKLFLGSKIPYCEVCQHDVDKFQVVRLLDYFNNFTSIGKIIIECHGERFIKTVFLKEYFK